MADSSRFKQTSQRHHTELSYPRKTVRKDNDCTKCGRGKRQDACSNLGLDLPKQI